MFEAASRSARIRRAVPGAGIVLVLALSLFWGLNWPIMKVALGEIPPWTFRATSTGFAGLLLLTATGLSGRRLLPTRREFLWLVLASLLNITLWMILSAYAVGLMDSGRAAIVAYTMPLWSILLGALFLREALTSERMIGVFLGLAGMALLLGEDLLGLHATPVGTLLMAGAALSWAAGTIVVKYATPALSTIALGGWQMLIGALPLATGALLLERVDPASISLQPALGLLYNMLIGSSLCVWIWFRIVALYAAGVAAMSTLLIPVIGVMSGAALLGEPVGWPEVMALILVITSLAIVHGIWRRQPPGP